MPEKTKNPDRFLYSTQTKYEFQFGYSRAIRHGSVIRVAGTAGLDDRGIVVSDSPSDQAKRALDLVEAAIVDLGGTLADVIMTRVYVSEVHNIEAVAVVHGERFRDIRPATTIVKADFVDPRILVEIEAEAVYGGAKDKR
ncbi:MAG TPA: Rid family hydrolase [Candidatus Limnocylindria bacterium]|jgi:enamine deaminase RidA (YjgF/YER057c/UK114 family)